MDFQTLKNNLQNVFISKSAILFVLGILSFICAQIFIKFSLSVLGVTIIVLGTIFCIGGIITWFNEIE